MISFQVFPVVSPPQATRLNNVSESAEKPVRDILAVTVTQLDTKAAMDMFLPCSLNIPTAVRETQSAGMYVVID